MAVQSFCLDSLHMQNLCLCRCRRVVDLKPSNDEKHGQTWTCNFEQRFSYRRIVDLELPNTSLSINYNSRGKFKIRLLTPVGHLKALILHVSSDLWKLVSWTLKKYITSICESSGESAGPPAVRLGFDSVSI